MAHVHSHEEAFADRNAFLQVALGWLSMCQGLADVALTLGPAREEPPSTELERNDAFLDAVVGVASLVRVTLAALQSSVDLPDSTASIPTTATEAVEPDLRAILA